MTINQTTLRSRARFEAGSPAETEIPNSNIDAYIQDALNKISENVLSWGVYSITTEAQKQNYVCSTGLCDVIFCDWSGTVSFSDVFDSDFNVLMSTDLYDVEIGLYDRVIDAMKKQQVRDNYDWHYDEGNNQLWLIPPPTQASKKVYYIGAKPWTLASIPSRFEKYIVWYAVAQVLTVVARKRRRESGISHVGSPFPWSLSDPTLQDAKALMKQFDEAMEMESKKNMLPGE